jgi:hypothetical protein
VDAKIEAAKLSDGLSLMLKRVMQTRLQHWILFRERAHLGSCPRCVTFIVVHKDISLYNLLVLVDFPQVIQTGITPMEMIICVVVLIKGFLSSRTSSPAQLPRLILVLEPSSPEPSP